MILLYLNRYGLKTKNINIKRIVAGNDIESNLKGRMRLKNDQKQLFKWTRLKMLKLSLDKSEIFP